MEKDDSVSVIFLAYNEAKTIEKEIRLFYEKITAKIPGSEIIIAEDGSTDGTTEIIQSLVKDIGVVHVSSKERKGYTKAFIDAVLTAKNDYLFFSDTGLKFDPDEFWKLYPLRREYDLVVGRRTKRNDSLLRRFFTEGYNLYLRTYFKLGFIHDADSGFRLFNKKVVEEIIRHKIKFRGFAGSELVLRAVLKGFRYCEVPVCYFQREGSSRSIPLKKIPSLIFRVINDLKDLKSELQE